MDFTVIKNFFTDIGIWIELHPALSSGIFAILGAILGALIDLRKKAVAFFSFTAKNIQKIKNRFFIIGNNNTITQTFNSEKKDTPPQSNVLLETYNGPLSSKQRECCKKVKDISTRHARPLEIEIDYTDAVKSLNADDEIYLCAGKFAQVFEPITRVLAVVSERENCKAELDQLSILVSGLYEMIQNEDEKEGIKRQIKSCEKQLWLLLVKLRI